MQKWMAFFVLVALSGVGSSAARAQAQKETKAPKPSAGIAAEFLDEWDRTGQKLVAMAQDFPEDKFDYKATPAQRTFAEQLLHVAGANYYFIAAASGVKPADQHVDENPSRATYKTRAQVVAFIQKSFADAAAVIQQQGDKGMLEAVRSPFDNAMYTRAVLWAFAMNHANDHYGQCVVYYRLNGLVPPESRNQQ
jgi:uncharacterized damage-inducible protein DinB